jgi:hypothetical protein
MLRFVAAPFQDEELVDDGVGDVVDDVLADPMMFVCGTGMGKVF